ncbi:MAG: metallophosphoesterase [Woeseiaceae bacterium]|nr:metallophosphoesterase [Woeseiaceae bacterium]
MLRVLHLTDPHLFADTGGALRGTVTYASLAAVLGHYRQGDWRADIAIVTGDLIQDDSAAAYGHFRDLLGGLGIPVLCLPGNHDVRALMQDALSDPPFRYLGSTELGNWLIVCLDSCVHGKAGGFVSDAELDRLDAVVAASGAPNVLVCLHHPVVPMQSEWLDTVGLENAADVLDRLAGHRRVRGCIFGHVHQDHVSEQAGIRVIATPSTCRQFRPRSKSFSLDDRPPAYRRIELGDDGAIDDELVWTDYSAKTDKRGSDEPFY